MILQKCRSLALRDILRRRAHLTANGAMRTEPSSRHANGFLGTQPIRPALSGRSGRTRSSRY